MMKALTIWVVALGALLAVFAHRPSEAWIVQKASGSPPTCTGPVDVMTSSTVVAAFGMNKLRNGYTGNVVNVDISSTPTDIPFSGCSIDTTNLSTCTAVGDCPVNTWYDQISGGPDCTSSGSNRPSLVINEQNGLPNIVFTDSSSTYCKGTLGASITANGFLFTRSVQDTSNSRIFLAFGNTGSTGATYYGLFSSVYKYLSGSLATFSSSSSFVQDSGIANSTSTQLYENGSAGTAGGTGTPPTNSIVILGAEQNGSSPSFYSSVSIGDALFVAPDPSTADSCAGGKNMAGLWAISTAGYGC